MFYDFLIQHWRLIISAGLFIVSFVLALVRKKPITNILSDIYECCIKAVKYVEESNIVGSDNKLARAILYVNELLVVIYPSFKLGSYDSVIKSTIEIILSTPQKK